MDIISVTFVFDNVILSNFLAVPNEKVSVMVSPDFAKTFLVNLNCVGVVPDGGTWIVSVLLSNALFTLKLISSNIVKSTPVSELIIELPETTPA